MDGIVEHGLGRLDQVVQSSVPPQALSKLHHGSLLCRDEIFRESCTRIRRVSASSRRGSTWLWSFRRCVRALVRVTTRWNGLIAWHVDPPTHTQPHTQPHTQHTEMARTFNCRNNPLLDPRTPTRTHARTHARDAASTLPSITRSNR
jgi:hypothetical protein